MSIGNNRRRILAMTGLAAGVLAAANVVCAQIPCGYEVTAVIQADPCAPPFDNPPPTIGLGISDEPSPRVVGYYFPCVIGPETAFQWSAEEGLTTLAFPEPTSQSWARDISGDGTQIVGTAVITGVGYHGYLIDDGKFIEIPPPAGTHSSAYAVSLGRVVGTTSDGTPYSKAYLWHEGRMTIIEPTYGPRSSGVDLNDMAQPQVVGWMGPTVDSDAHAFLWENCQVSDLGVVPGGYTGVGTSINNLGQITIAGKLVNPEGGLWLKIGFPVGPGPMDRFGRPAWLRSNLSVRVE